MHIDNAKRLRTGQSVQCPKDGDTPAYTGRVQHVGTPEGGGIAHGTQAHYLWVTVTHPTTKRNEVWPSNRLGWAA